MNSIDYRKSGAEWASFFNLKFTNFDGWFSLDDFNNEKITRGEFLNRASQCVIEPPPKKSRREAERYRQVLMNSKYAKKDYSKDT